ncbi:SHOCT domain-containing protein [Acholeplasma granularum]|uniref:SHOCT domain-containing protein n=1 Tax=Acholeplasma granularum TaxID=264635 RepID=UPI0004722A29|nr:SHOCT domain-containing protein [Acholeplasma granularum]
MKKNYHTGLLTAGIILVLALIASFVLQNYFKGSYLTLSYQFDTFVLMAVAFMLILQFKSFDKIVSIVLVIYGAFNILYGITGSYAVSNIVQSVEIEVIFTLGLLLGHVLFEIAALFILVHVMQTRFELKFTKTFVRVTLLVSAVFLIAISPFVTSFSLQSILRMVFQVIAILATYFAVQQLVFERPAPEVVTNTESNKKLDELNRLYQRGLISKDEFESRLNQINK